MTNQTALHTGPALIVTDISSMEQSVGVDDNFVGLCRRMLMHALDDVMWQARRAYAMHAFDGVVLHGTA